LVEHGRGVLSRTVYPDPAARLAYRECAELTVGLTARLGWSGVKLPIVTDCPLVLSALSNRGDAPSIALGLSATWGDVSVAEVWHAARTIPGLAQS
jgi:hypothetical protein